MSRVQLRRKVRSAKDAIRDTVTVACKIPNGMRLQLHRQEEYQDPVMGGGHRTCTRWVPYGDQVVVRGPAIPWGMMSPNIIYGMRLTQNIDAEFFAEWLRQNSNHDAVKNRMIWAYETRQDVVDQAKEEQELVSGLQPLDVEMITVKRGKRRVERIADKRIGEPIHPHLSPIQEGEKEDA